MHWSPPQPEDCPPRYALSVCYFVDGATRLVAADCRKQAETEVGLALFTSFCAQNTDQLMTAGVVYVTNLTPPGSGNPRQGTSGATQTGWGT